MVRTWPSEYKRSSAPPGVLAFVSDGPMNEVQVNVLTIKSTLTGLKGFQSLVIAMIGVVHLGGQKNILARHTRMTDGIAYFHFVVVHRGGINQTITNF